jgi:hypothetical protein
VLLQQDAKPVALDRLIGMHGAIGQVWQAEGRCHRQDREKKAVLPAMDYFFPVRALGVASAFRSPNAY